MNIPVIYNYQGNNISFVNDKNIMINATEMAKSFGKTTKDWLRTNASREFINSLSAVRQICPSQLVIVRKGNSNEFEQGTWMHEDVALEFARWLSPAFAIWCNDRIKELLKYGMTATQPTLDELVNNPDLIIRIATQLKQERAEKVRLQTENTKAKERITKQDAQLKEDAPKVAFANAIISSKTSCLIGELAKLIKQATERTGKRINIGQNRLFEWMRENGFLGKSGSRHNIANQEYIEQGLFELKKSTYDNNGVLVTTTTTKVTSRGQMYFINGFLNGKFKMK